MTHHLPPDYLPDLPLGFRHGCVFLKQPEQDGHQDDSAPGEDFRTSWGIIPSTWEQAVKDGIVTGRLEDATRPMAGNILLANFWNKMLLGQLPTAVGFTLFCDATLTGVGRTTKGLQGIVGGGTPLKVDGVIGENTLHATLDYLARFGQDRLVNQLIDIQLDYLRSRPTAATFIRGWTRREEEQRLIALDIVAGEAKAGPPQPPSISIGITSPVTPIPGYQPQSQERLAWVTTNKEVEEQILRILDSLAAVGDLDGRFLAISRTHIEEGFMAMNRAIMQPTRIKLPGDPE